MKTWIIILAVLLVISVVINVALAFSVHFLRKEAGFNKRMTAAMIDFD